MVIQSLLLGLASALLWGFSDVVAVGVARRVGALATALGIAVLGTLIVAPLYAAALIRGESRLEASSILSLLGVSVVGSLGMLSFYKGLQLGPVAVVTPIASAYAMVVVALALWLQGESLTPVQAAGAAAVIAGVVLVSMDLAALRGAGPLVGPGPMLAVVAMVAAGVWQYGLGVLSKTLGWLPPVFFSHLFGLATLVAVAALTRRHVALKTNSAGVAPAVLFSAITSVAGLFTFTLGTEKGLIAIVGAAATSYVVVPVAVGLLVFHERLAVNQLAGLGLLTGGLVAMALG